MYIYTIRISYIGATERYFRLKQVSGLRIPILGVRTGYSGAALELHIQIHPKAPSLKAALPDTIVIAGERQAAGF